MGGGRRGVIRVLVEKPDSVIDRFGDSGLEGRIILRWTFRKWKVGVWTGWSWLRIGTVGRHL
jgi:hypothetical protein